MIRVVLPYHLRALAGVDGEVRIEIDSPATLRAVLDELEARYPALRGTIRDQATLQRRPFVRFYACELDFSHQPPQTVLPPKVDSGEEPLLVIGAMAGG
jgi:sulfur-carrier protein